MEFAPFSTKRIILYSFGTRRLAFQLLNYQLEKRNPCTAEPIPAVLDRNHRSILDFIWTMLPLGRITGVCNDREIVWLPVARSQKARFASRKRIRAFQPALIRRGTDSKAPLAIDLHRG